MAKAPKKKGILDCFNGTPREVQANCLKEIEAKWDSTDIFVIVAPTATGKTKIAECIQQWCKSRSVLSSYLVPNNALLQQFSESVIAPILPVRSKRFYTCTPWMQTGGDAENWCKNSDGSPKNCEQVWSRCKGSCRGRCPYLKDIFAMKDRCMVAMNMHSWYAHKVSSTRKGCLIIDEAHNLVPVLQGLGVKTFWAHDWGFPPAKATIASLLKWAQEGQQHYKGRSELSPDDKAAKRKFDALAKELEHSLDRFFVQRELCEYRGARENCIKLLPISVKDQVPQFIGDSKLVLMSATIGLQDIKMLGLMGKRVEILYCESPIPAENRPFRFWPLMSHAFSKQGAEFCILVDFLLEALEEHSAQRGMIHVTYELMSKLEIEAQKGRLTQYASRLKFAHQWEKQRVLDAFVEDGQSDAVLVAAGLEEGLDLAGDLARWQLIAKVPWPSLQDPVIKHQSEVDPEWYLWEAAKKVVQAAGRVCRTPQDYGVTYCVDKSFLKLYESGIFKKSCKFFLDALVMEEQQNEDANT